MNDFISRWITQGYLEKLSVSGVRILLILLLALLVFKLVRRALNRLEKRMLTPAGEGSPTENEKRVQTLLRLFWQVVSVVIWVVVILVALAELGIDMRPVLAGAGIVGLAVGFGAQNLVRDVISGFFMILEDQIRVGDAVLINGTPGVVEQINLRTVVLRDVADVVHVFPNGTINTLSNQTKEVSAYVFDVAVDWSEDSDDVVELIRAVLNELVVDEKWSRQISGDPEIFGVAAINEQSFTIKGRIRTVPGAQWAVGREFLRRVKKSFGSEGVRIPLQRRSFMLAESILSPVAEAVLKSRDGTPGAGT